MSAARTTLFLSVALGILPSLTACGQERQASIKHMNAGIEAANTQSFATSERELEQAMTIDPENHFAAYTLGQVYIKEEKWDKAVAALLAAINISDGDPMYHYHLGHAYLELGKLELARPDVERALALNGRLFKAHYFLGRLHAIQDRPKDAAKAWTESCRLNPGFGKPFLELGKLYYSWDYMQEAVSVLLQGAQNARDLDDRSDLYYQLGMAYDALAQNGKAIAAYESSLAEKRDNLDARLQLGFAYAVKGDKAKARGFLEEFMKVGGGQSPFKIQAAQDRLLKLAAE